VDAKWTDEELALLKDGMEQAKKAKKLLVKAATWDWIVKTVSLKRTGRFRIASRFDLLPCSSKLKKIGWLERCRTMAQRADPGSCG